MTYKGINAALARSDAGLKSANAELKRAIAVVEAVNADLAAQASHAIKRCTELEEALHAGAVGLGQGREAALDSQLVALEPAACDMAASTPSTRHAQQAELGRLGNCEPEVPASQVCSCRLPGLRPYPNPHTPLTACCSHAVPAPLHHPSDPPTPNYFS